MNESRELVGSFVESMTDTQTLRVWVVGRVEHVSLKEDDSPEVRENYLVWNWGMIRLDRIETVTLLEE